MTGAGACTPVATEMTELDAASAESCKFQRGVFKVCWGATDASILERDNHQRCSGAPVAGAMLSFNKVKHMPPSASRFTVHDVKQA